jgi:hypothetical protein
MSAARVLKIRGAGVPPAGSRGTAEAGPTDPVAAWLRVVEPLLKLPEPERRAIVEELENHLRERVRDQLLAGMAEGDAVRAAVAELGDAAALARRFREAGKTPLRRTAMNLAVLGVAGAAMITSIAAVGGGSAARHTPTVSVYQQPTVSKAENGPKAPVVQEAAFTNIALERALAEIADITRLKLVARWERMENEGVDRAHPITLVARDADLGRVFQMINEDLGGSAIDYRLVGNVLEVGPRSFFDRRDAELVSFDVGRILDGGVQPNELVGAIVQMVEQESWADSGGASGSMTIVGKRLFVKAPARMWKKAAWMLDQLAPEAGKPEAREGVPLLSDIHTGTLFTRIPESAHRDVQPVQAELSRAREQAAWTKAALGMELSDGEKALLTDKAAKVIPPGDPKRADTEAELNHLLSQISALESQEASLKARLGGATTR